MTINTRQWPNIDIPSKYKKEICILAAVTECLWVHTSVHSHWKGACNHSSSMVIDLEVDMNVKVSPKDPAVFNSIVQLD